MRSITSRRERGHWSRSLVLVALLATGTACGGSAGSGSADNRPSATTGRAGEPGTTGGGPQQATPSPLGNGPAGDTIAGLRQSGRTQAPPPPDLGNWRPVEPPDTVSLEELHRQGRTHVLR